MSSRTRAELLETIRRRLHDLDDPKLTVAVEDLDHAAPNALAAFRRMQDARAGLPGAQAYDSPSVSGGSSSSSTERAAVGPTCVRCDVPGECRCASAPPMDATSLDRRTLDRVLRQLDGLTRPALVLDSGKWHAQITGHCLTIRNLVASWTPRPPTDKQRQAVEAANTPAVPLCDHCTPHRAKGCTEPVHRTGDAAGNLDEPLGLCHWCYRFVLRVGRLPDKREIERNDNGQRVMVKA